MLVILWTNIPLFLLPVFFVISFFLYVLMAYSISLLVSSVLLLSIGLAFYLPFASLLSAYTVSLAASWLLLPVLYTGICLHCHLICMVALLPIPSYILAMLLLFLLLPG